MKRLLVTASRNWTDNTLFALHFGQAMGWLRVPLDEITVMHGACPDGGDLMAHQICTYMRYNEDPHPADWKRYGRSAGHRRNADMVFSEPRPALCIAFIASCINYDCKQEDRPHGSHGARGTVFLAEKIGMPTWKFYSDDSLGVSTVPPLGGAETA